MERSLTKAPQLKSDMASGSVEMKSTMEMQKESRKISVSSVEPRKRARDDEEYVPRPVSEDRIDLSFIVNLSDVMLLM